MASAWEASSTISGAASTRWALAKDAVPEGDVCLSTCPTALGWLDGTDDAPRFGPGHFDLVIVDVAHRGICRQYRAIFSYFDALLVGLTAMPKEAIDRNTYDVFGLAAGLPTEAYGLDEAIADHHLVPPRTVSVPVRLQREAIRYDDLSDTEKDQRDTLEWDDGNADASAPEAADAWLHHQDAVDEMIALVMEARGHRVAGGDWIGKTLIFARNHGHAQLIAERFDANYPQYKSELACVITYEAGQTQALVDAFSVADRMPRIAISAGLLDIGIAVPEVVNPCSSGACAPGPGSGGWSAAARDRARTCTGRDRTSRMSWSSTSAGTSPSSMWIPRPQRKPCPHRWASACSGHSSNC